MQELSDFWRATSPDEVNIFRDFSPREFAAALHHSKPGKASEPDSICPELLIHAGPGLKSWLRGFLPSCLRQLKIPMVCRRAIPKPSKTGRGPNNLPSHLSALCLLQDPRTTDLQSCRTNSRPLASKQAGFRHGKSTVDQAVLLMQTIEDSFEAKKMWVLCLSI